MYIETNVDLEEFIVNSTLNLCSMISGSNNDVHQERKHK